MLYFHFVVAVLKIAEQNYPQSAAAHWEDSVSLDSETVAAAGIPDSFYPSVDLARLNNFDEDLHSSVAVELANMKVDDKMQHCSELDGVD